MKKLLVTGASGFLGWNICQVAKLKWDVYGTYNSREVSFHGITFIQTDITNFADLKRLFQDVEPDAVIHAAAHSKPNFCQQHPQESYLINVTASLNIASLCADADIPCAFTSTDLVFDGLNPPYRESARVCPINIYGEQKVEAERGMLIRYPKTAICRMPLMFGMASPCAESFIQGFIRNLKAGKRLNLFVDEFRTMVGGETAVMGLLLAIEKRIEGRLHLGGKERISRYNFGKLMAEVLGFPVENIAPCRQQDVEVIAPRSPDTSLDSSKAFALGYRPPSIREELEALRGRV
ncbi:MAG: SDR family oxidoreductase [Limnospira sp.]